MNVIYKLVLKFLLLTSVNVLITVIFLVYVFIRIKTKQLDCWSVIKNKQIYINMILSTYIWGFSPVILGAFLWMITFILFKTLLFKNDKFRLSAMYREYELQSRPYLEITIFSQIKNILNYPTTCKIETSECNYTLNFHSNSLFIPVIFCCLGIVAPISHNMNLTLYYIEYLIVATALAIILGKIVFYFNFYSYDGLTFASPILSGILVIMVEIFYYFLAIIFMLITSGQLLLK